MKKFTKVTKYILLTVFVMVVLAIVATQTPMFKSWLKNKVVTLAQPYIDGDISVGSLEGNLFSELALNNVRVARGQNTIILIDEIFIDYSLLALLSKEIIVSEFVLHNPNISLIKQAEGGWNIAEMFKTGDAPEETEHTKSSFDWQLEFPSFRIDSGRVTFSGIEPSGIRVPEEVRDIQLNLAFTYTSDFLDFTLKALSLEARNPDLEIKELESVVEIAEDDLDTTNIELKLKTTRLQSKFKIDNFEQPWFDASVQARPLSFSEMRKIFEDLPLYGKLNLSVQVRGRLEDLQARFDLSHEGGAVNLTGNFDVDSDPYRYDLNGKFSDVDLSKFTNKQELKSDLDLTLDLEGAGTEWGKLTADVSIKADSGYVMGRSYKSLELDAEAHEDSLQFNMELFKGSGHASLAGYLIQNEDVTKYDVNGDVLNLNLQEVTKDSVMATDLNFNFQLNGQEFDPDSLRGRFVADFASSRINNIKLDTAHTTIVMANQLLEVKDFQVKSPIVNMKADGSLGMQDVSEIKFSAELDDLSRTADAFGMASKLSGNGSLSGKVSGKLDSFLVDAKLNFENVEYPDISLAEFRGELTGKVSDESHDLQLQGEIFRAEAANFRNVNSNFTIDYQDSLIGFQISLEKPAEFSVETSGDLALGEIYEIQLQELGFDVLGQTWQKTDSVTKIVYNEPELNITKLTLFSDDQTITLLGGLGAQDSSNVKLQVANLDVEKIIKLFNPDVQFRGRLNFETTLTQTLASPKIVGNFNIQEGKYFGKDFHRLSGNYNYRNERMDWRFSFMENQADSTLNFTGFLPYSLSLSPFKNELLSTQPVEIKLVTPGLDLAFLQLFMKGVEALEGKLLADVTLQNTLQDLSGEGEITLAEAKLHIPELGVKYEDIKIDLVLDEKEIAVNDFNIDSGDGDLTIAGGSLSLSQQQIDRFELNLKANNFEAMDTDELEAVVDGRIDISGSVQEITFDGDLTVVQAVVYYPAWMPEEGAVELTDKPFFVILEDTTEFDSAGAIRFQEVDVETTTPFTETEFYKNIRGKLSLTIDRNTWLRSEEANIEVEGDLEMQKEGADFVLFGSVSTVRGYYELQGRRFQIEEGEITFKGNPEFNPDIRLTAIYEYSNWAEEGADAEEHEMTVTITGTKEAPEFEFTLDGQPAEQKDVFSILLFGKPMDELSISQSNRASEESGGFNQQAQGFFAGQLMKRVSQRVADELNLDVLQIESGDELGDTRVRVGEYVTDDVFVSVTQDFGVEGEQKVKLEYKLPQKILLLNLFLQALRERQGNSAVDLIWKYEW